MAVHWGFGIVAILFYLVVIAALVLVVVAAIRLLGGGRDRPSAPPGYPVPPGGTPGTPPVSARETPLDILSRRFASGEISAEEYEKARDLLQGGTNPPAS